MAAPIRFAARTFPSRVADLGFTTDLPVDWIAHDLPRDDVDIANPTAFIPLAVVTAPHVALIFAFLARPAHREGTLHDWTVYHLNEDGLKPRAIGRGRVAGVAAVVGEATKDSELGRMLVRFAFLEDGGRLINLTLAAPEMLEATVRGAWFAMLNSFQLETARGSRFPIEDHPDLIPAAQIPEPWMQVRADTSDSPIPGEENPTHDAETPAIVHGNEVNVSPSACKVPAPEPASDADLASESQREPVIEAAPNRAAHESTPETPAWSQLARRLEAQDQLAAAERAIRDGCPHIGFAAATAEMYRRRMRRLLQAGDADGALEAFRKADEFIFFYASLATSGGEGAALSQERDAFRRELVAEFGHDPEARCA